MTRTQIINRYADFGWQKLLEIDWIFVGRDKVPRLIKYRFNADTLSCSRRSCRHQLTFVKFKPHGVVWTCATCRKTMGAVSFEEAVSLNGQMGEEISLIDAWEVIRRTGQKEPAALEAPSGTESLIIIDE